MRGSVSARGWLILLNFTCVDEVHQIAWGNLVLINLQSLEHALDRRKLILAVENLETGW